MHRDQQQESGFEAARRPARKEWEPGREQSHQMEPREHARQGGKTRGAPKTGAPPERRAGCANL